MYSEQKYTNIFDVDKEFFVITSDTLETVESRFYGYDITADGRVILEVSALAGAEELSGDGAYVYVERDKDAIRVSQDSLGCYGLYLYRDGDFWALSNSFLYLEERLRDSHLLTLNKEYADALIASPLCSHAYDETMICGIHWLDRTAEVQIGIRERLLKIEYRREREFYISLDSQEGMDLLDRWYRKWTGIIRGIKEQNGSISTDLSGGMDSRMVLNLFLGSGVDCNEIFVLSYHDELHTHIEDYEIAGSIAQAYGFRLNNKENLPAGAANYSPEDILNISHYLKMGFHKEMYWAKSRRSEYVYKFYGGGGEILRQYWGDGGSAAAEHFIEDNAKRAEAFDGDHEEIGRSVHAVFRRALLRIEQGYAADGGRPDQDTLLTLLYKETRNRNHFGRVRLEWFFEGDITLGPLMDPELYKLKLTTADCSDRNLLMTVMFDRYNKELLDFKFDSGRSIAEETITYARELNAKYPFADGGQQKEDGAAKTAFQVLKTPQTDVQNPPVSDGELTELLKKVFYAPDTRSTFKKLYPHKTYERIGDAWKNVAFHPESGTLAAAAICKVSRDCMTSARRQLPPTAGQELLCAADEYLQTKTATGELAADRYLACYTTARIDIKNSGSERNDLRIEELSDASARVEIPQWFAENGTGYVIMSDRGSLRAVFRCIESGNLRIYLKGMDVRDAEDRRLPIYVDILRFSVNDKVVSDAARAVSHDEPFVYSTEAEDGEQLEMELEWRWHDARENNIAYRKYEDLHERLALLEEQKEGLRQENDRLQEKVRHQKDRIAQQKEKVRHQEDRIAQLKTRNENLKSENKRLQEEPADQSSSRRKGFGRK